MRTRLPISFRLILFFVIAFQLPSFSQTVQITANPGQSGNVVIGPNGYHVEEAIYTETEISASGFISAPTAINHIDFSVFALGSPTAVSNFNIYLKEVPLATTTFTSTTDVYSTAGYTLVFSGTFNANVTGWVGVDLSTPFTRTTGNNLQLLIERLDNVTHGAFSFNCARGNNTSATITTGRRINTNTLPVSGTTVLNTISAFRPQIQLRHINANDAAVTTVYTLGKLPIPFAAPHVISANIINNGAATQNNLNVTLDISGANNFSDVQTIASLAPGASAKVNFGSFTPVAAGNNIVTVSIPADDFPADNNLSIAQEVTNNAYSYAYGTVPTNGVGVNSNTGDFVAMFTSSSPTSVNQVGVNFSAGGQPFRIGIWDKSGLGAPGNLLWESTDQVSTTGVFTLPIVPAVAITDTFYIGVRQIGTTNIQFSYQNESPIRAGTFFFTSPTGNTVWTDFAPSNPFKFMIEPRLSIANDVGVSSINNPVGASSIDNCGIVPQASVTNFGSSNQTTPFDVTFSIKQSGGTVYTDTKQITLNSGETQAVYFTPFTGSVSGSDSSFVITSLGTDGATNNDTVVNKFTTSNYSYSDSTVTSDGYSYANSTVCANPAPLQPVYSWITQTANEINWNLNGDDSVLATPISLPFNFKFFGNTFNQFWISSNGWISFTNPTTLAASVQRNPVAIPLAGGIENYIAGALTDLDITTGTYSDAHTYYGGDASQFIITFQHAHLFGSVNDYITFQIILMANGDIIVHYNDAESSVPVSTTITNFCSVGIENADGTKGIQYRLNGSGGPMFGSPLALHFYTRPGTTTPVTLLNFNVQKLSAINKITWSTSQEINSRSFVIERSSEGRNFTEIGQVAAHGNSNRVIDYSFTDNTPFKGFNYYRLKMLDIDNIERYSTVKSTRNDDPATISVYPNPAKDNMYVTFNSNESGKTTLNITDLSGKVVYSTTLLLNAGLNRIPFNIATLSKGTYLLKMILPGKIISRKINKL
ncbi:MAG: T9SS type A sorting domain-containing protein [Chitinophagaceae bacterium]|nr:T9SS type A sorting domain-containing protein [Chitinophagaceae bacterium]